MLLPEQSLQELTGYVQPAAQIRWLRRHGWRFTVNGLGKPIIALSEFNRRMVGGKPVAQPDLDWSAIDGTTTH